MGSTTAAAVISGEPTGTEKKATKNNRVIIGQLLLPKFDRLTVWKCLHNKWFRVWTRSNSHC